MAEDASQQSGILVVGIGNADRGDDVGGLLAVRQIRHAAAGAYPVMEHTGDGTGLIELWEGIDRVIVVDVMRSGSAAGTIERFDATLGSLPAALFHNSTHTFGLHEAIELSRALQRLPHQLIVYGIEGKNFALAAGLSPAIKYAQVEVVHRVLRELRESQSWQPT